MINSSIIGEDEVSRFFDESTTNEDMAPLEISLMVDSDLNLSIIE